MINGGGGNGWGGGYLFGSKKPQNNKTILSYGFPVIQTIYLEILVFPEEVHISKNDYHS